MPVEDLGVQAAELLSLAGLGEERSLSGLAELAVMQVPGCSGACASLWRDGELDCLAATHPDAAALAEVQLAAGAGPLLAAVAGHTAVGCKDTLGDTRWPRYAGQALRRGVRCSTELARTLPPLTLVLSLFAVRPGALDSGSVPMAATLAAFGRAMLANSMMYGEARRTANQLKDSVEARAVVDQAKGIMMHALGCDAETALDYLRAQSQRRHIKVTELAARVIQSRG